MPLFLRAAGAISLALLPAPVSTASPALTTMSDIPAGAHPEVVRVDCAHGRGSAFHVSPHVILSVNHVTSLEGCQINGEPIRVIYHSGDFSIIRTDRASDRWLKIDCGGFVPGRRYTARGFARGLDTLTDVDLVASGFKQGSWSILFGVFTVVPGQSGGPVIDATSGKVTGLVNVYDARAGISGSVALKDTALCA